MTAGPTLAMLAAVRRAVYEIPFGGRAHFQYIADVALPFIHAVHTSSTDAIERNIGGPSEHVTDVIAALEVAAPEAAGTITFKGCSRQSDCPAGQAADPLAVRGSAASA